MSLDINAAIFIAFLAGNFLFGLWTSRGVNTLRGYAIGDKDFSTATLVATIVATWVSGSFFFAHITETYTGGVNYMYIPLLGDFLCLLFIGSFFAPRMGEFLGKLSIAEAMGGLYGNNVRIITAISGVIGVAGIIAVQLKIAGLLFEYALGVKPIYGIIFSGIIITLYSSLGGIKSVTLTDVVQFATFCAVIPIISYFLFGDVGSNQIIIDTLENNPIFDHSLVFSFSNPNIFYFLSIFIWNLIPPFDPAYFQRIAMAKSTRQAGRAFNISSFICFFLVLIVCWIAVLALSLHPNMDESEIFKFIINNAVWITGFKGVILIGIMAMVMSTVDSYINSSAVLITHDLRQALNISFIKNELFSTRMGAMLIGSIAILFAMREGSFIDLFIWANMFYTPVVSVPFILAIMGFRSSNKAVLIGMVAGFSAAMIWELFFKIGGVGGLIPGVVVNVIFFFTSHYLLNQPGGWVGVKNPIPLLELREARKLKYEQIRQKIKSFNFIEGCVKNTPKGDGLMFFLGMCLMLSSMISVTTLQKDIHAHYVSWLDTLYPIVLCCAGPLTSYLLWFPPWRKDPRILGIVWNAIMFYALICFSFLIVLMSNFAATQLMVFMANILVIATLVNWRWSLPAILIGVFGTLIIYAAFAPPSIISQEIQASKFNVLYLLLIIFSLTIIFLKPKQEYIEATEHKVDELEHENVHLGQEVTSLSEKVTDLDEKVIHYSQRAADQTMEIERLEATAQKILNNVNHELRLPVSSVMNFAEMLSEGLKKYNDNQLKELSDEVFKNSNRLSTMIFNMLDLAMLDVKKIELDKKTINLGELVEDRVNSCRKIYLQGKKIDFELKIEPNIFVSIDPNYIRQTVDNLVINAITYSQSGTIRVSVLKKGKNQVELIVQDEGIGIPESGRYDIFNPFKMGIHTQSKAEGRGVGLALCKSAVETHGGAINVISENRKGAAFVVTLGL